MKIPRPWLFAGILSFSILGAYSLNSNVIDLVILLIVGILGFVMRMLKVPVVPCLLGLILGPTLEYQLRRSLMANLGDPTVFLTRPISLGLLLLAVAFIIVPVLMRLRRNKLAPAAT